MNTIGDRKNEKSKPIDWGPSDSESDDSEFTGTTGTRFFSKENFENTWTFLEDNLGLFQCHLPGSSAKEEISVTGSIPNEGTTKSSQEPESLIKAASTVTTPRSLGGTTATALSSLTKEKLMQADWFSHPRLQKLMTKLTNEQSTGVRKERKDGIPQKILEEPVYLSDMDTFLSDEFTPMDQGYFNNMYDHLCNPLVKPARRKQKTMCTALNGEHNSVVLSFDDTISKLTMEDGQKSVSTGSLNKLERAKEQVKSRATIAAIVNAQEKGGWRSMAKEEAEAKAEELSRFGIERTLAETKIQKHEDRPAENVIIIHHMPEPENEEDDDDDAEFQGDMHSNFPRTGNSKSSKSVRKRLLHPFKILKKKDKSPCKDHKGSKQKLSWPPFSPPRKPGKDDDPASPILSDTEPCSITTLSECEPSPIVQQGEEQVFVQVEGRHGDPISVVQLEPKREPEQPNLQTPEGVALRDKQCCGGKTQDEGEINLAKLEEQIFLQIENEKQQQSLTKNVKDNISHSTHFNDNAQASQASTQRLKKSSSIVEEVEVLPKRREPVYTSYVRSNSYNVVEDVEVLRKESSLERFCSELSFDDEVSGSELSTLKMTTKYRPSNFFEFDSPLLAPVKEESGSASNRYSNNTEDDSGDEDDDDGWRKRVVHGNEWFFEEKELPPPSELNDMNDDHNTACSSITPSLLTMTSRLEQERQETEKLRLMLQKKDEDLERLREMLQMNESKAVVERFNLRPSATSSSSSSRASPISEKNDNLPQEC